MEKVNPSKVLVIGAGGQLGGVVLDHLLAAGRTCVALVRPHSGYCPPASDRLSVVFGDMADPASLDRACSGVTEVVTTANAVVPRRSGEFGATEIINHGHLLNACRRHDIRRLVFVSGFVSPDEDRVPETRIKRQIESRIIASGVPFTIFRSAAFMDVYFASLGSRLASVGVARPTARRGHWLPAWHARLTEGLVEDAGIALVPGRGRTRHSFICISDVAAFLCAALETPSAANRTFDIGGPETLSWDDVVTIYREILDRPIRSLPTPPFVFRLLSMLARPFSPVAENVLRLLYALGRFDHSVSMKETARLFGVKLTPARRFVEGKARDAGLIGDRPTMTEPTLSSIESAR